MLLNFSNIELRVIDENNFHAKGYLFKLKNNYELIIGSSNLTQDALSKNTEYNLKLSLSKNSKLKSEALSLFTRYFSRGIKVSESFLNEYEKVYGEIKRLRQKKCIGKMTNMTLLYLFITTVSIQRKIKEVQYLFISQKIIIKHLVVLP